jgi:hypothetical protein
VLAGQTHIVFKIADTWTEFHQIHRLNYCTFVTEIPQHPPNPDEILIDKFHDKNTYIVAKRNQQVLGMVSFCSQPPFSLHTKIADLDAYLPRGKNIAEIRLLSIIRHERKKRIITGLFLHLHRLLVSKNIDFIIASGVEHQLKLYSRLGFQPFAHWVGSPTLRFQPIMLEVKKVAEYAKKFTGCS